MKLILRLTSIVVLIGSVLHLSCKKEPSCEGCRDGNKPPIAVAGPDQVITLPADSVLLDARQSSDPDGMISNWLWAKISGPASFTIIKPADSTTKVKALIAGIYQFEVKVTDDEGLSAKDTVRITVNDPGQPNRPPVANAGPDQTITLPANATQLDGSGSSDPDNNITTYLWTKISGPSTFNIINANAAQTTLTDLTEGSYLFELKVTDAGGLFLKDTMKVLVSSSTVGPAVVNAGPDIIITLPLDSIYLGWWIHLPPANYAWSQVSGPSAATVINSAFLSSLNPNIALVKHLIPGLYSFQLKASNSAGIGSDTVNVLVVNDPQDLNTITFKNLKWILADEYGIGITDLSLRLPSVPNLFFQSAQGMSWQLVPFEIFLQTDPATQWINLNVSQPIPPYYNYDTAIPNVWIMRIPVDSTWVGKESNVKIKVL